MTRLVEATRELAGEDTLVFCLPHPRTGERIQFALDGPMLLEMQRMAPDAAASWLVDDSVQQDGSIMMFTPVDPLFILLPVLETCRRRKGDSAGVFCALDDLLQTIPGLSVLARVKQLEQKLGRVCDVQAVPGHGNVYRLNDSKVIGWLQRKVNRIVSKFAGFATLVQMERVYYAEPGVQDNVGLQQAIRVWLAITVVDDYLNQAWRDRLRTAYESTLEPVVALLKRRKRVAAAAQNASLAKAASTTGTRKGKTAAAAARGKKPVNTKGMMSLRSYFSAKPS
ncbi:ribonuclease H2, subunit B [Thamnocephalis sphaerospora]|uniref:Ribonuclease H2 subunit B n=1 Tax=Thamnocephalis sphaerospora TaxID=78915 RepID=A0A4P9XKZ7_9FUNG|nr:ribonuclease H2, subunit B [Thamnocephalis sphaerospora]|eukprot:RKP05960.1 ribonuclease H2, subunit B [Thamnocephalis sphaerospora]